MHSTFKLLLLLLSASCFACANGPTQDEIKRYKEQAARVTIIRDKWGVPHVYGKTDADAVFGLMYAQCEENFKRVEMNYIKILGRLAEVSEDNSIYNDLKMRLIYDSSAAVSDYKSSPVWLKKLLDAFADGVNYYLYKNPKVKPVLLKRFEPWFPLMFTDGSITATRTGGLTEKDIENLYGQPGVSTGSINGNKLFDKKDFDGSNAFAIGPSKTASKNAMLYINPHTTFYFRTEAHIVSEEGLNAYGAVTWGQFFVFQGFNEHCGWAHTSSEADATDLYEEKIIEKDKQLFYEFDAQVRPVTEMQLQVGYKKDEVVLNKKFNIYKTHHGFLMGSRNGKWLSLKETNRSMNSLMQSWLRTKAKGFTEFKQVMELRGNNSNNTTYADDSGNIAYWHGNFIPVRDVKYDWSSPVDGSTSATEWKGTHAVSETIHFYNPSNGWTQNCNSTPLSATGRNNLASTVYPTYMAPDKENFRSLNALRLLSQEDNFTLDKLISVGYSRYLPAFDTLLPPLITAYDNLPASDPLKQTLTEPIQMLKRWNKASSVTSVETTLSTEYAYRLVFTNPPSAEDKIWNNDILLFNRYANNTSSLVQLNTLNDVIIILQRMYGTWKVPWGEMNRYQRTAGNIIQKFEDNEPSTPVGLASAFFGSLPSYEVNRIDTKKRYGTSGNSFVAAVEFGKRIKAKSIVTGGQFFDPSSKHFTDQAAMYAEGKFKDVLFYREDVMKNKERMYHPGE